MGGFITAKHVVMDFKNKHVPTLYGVQTTAKNEHHVRVADNFSFHPKADIVMGMLAERIEEKKRIAPERAIPFKLSFEQLNVNDKISSYAYPQVKSEKIDKDEMEFTFEGEWTQGEILEFCPNGRGKTQNKCYMTSMDIRCGASGGPVIHNDRVIGINSSGMDGVYSLITPIDLMLDMVVVGNNKTTIPVKELVEGGYIFVDGY